MNLFLVLLLGVLIPPPPTAASAFLTTTSVSSTSTASGSSCCLSSSPALISPAATVLRANTNSPSTSLLLLVSNSAANDCEEKDMMIARTVDELLRQVGGDDADDKMGPADGGRRDNVIIKDLMATLSNVGGQEEEEDGTGSNYDFDRLLGYYNVSFSLPARPGMDNPVGGRWTRRRGGGGGGRTSGRQRRWLGGLWTVSRTLQHVLPPRMTVPPPPPPPADDAGSGAASGDSRPGEATETAVAAGVVVENVVPSSSSSHPSPSVPASVAQVVNAIKLDCLWGLLCLWVVLRGDAVPLWEDQAAATAATALGSTGSGTPANDDRNRNNNGRNDRQQQPPSPSPSPLKLLPDLSHRAVRVYFDRPRIGVRLTAPLLRSMQSVLSLGPTSSVVIDTPYVDGRVRLGRGGTSGSLFVFARLLDETAVDAEARDGWRWVVDGNNFNNGARPENGGGGAAVVVASPSVLTQRKLLLHCCLRGAISALACTLLSVVPAPQQQHVRAVFRMAKWIAASSAAVSLISFLWLACSTGGIETRRRGGTYIPGR